MDETESDTEDMTKSVVLSIRLPATDNALVDATFDHCILEKNINQLRVYS